MTAEERKARERLGAAIDTYAIWRERTSWTNGYRCGGHNSAENYAREMAQYGHMENARKAVGKAVSAYARAIRRAAKEAR